VGGNGVAWAVPRGRRLPPVERCTWVEGSGVVRSVPRPPGALEDYMEAVEGDGSPWSYVCASLLARQLGEFGAWWHGLDWSTHLLVGKQPDLRNAPEPEKWRGVADPPTHWLPSVVRAEDAITVRLHTYSEVDHKAFYEHRDTYEPGSYRCLREKIILIEGPHGYCL
jgi:hypothetical protein